MKSDTFHSFWNLSQRVCVGMFALRNTCAKDTGDRELCTHAVLNVLPFKHRRSHAEQDQCKFHDRRDYLFRV